MENWHRAGMMSKCTFRGEFLKATTKAIHNPHLHDTMNIQDKVFSQYYCMDLYNQG